MKKKDRFLLKDLEFYESLYRDINGRAIGYIGSKSKLPYCGMYFTYPSGIPTIDSGNQINEVIRTLYYDANNTDKEPLPLRYCRKFLRANLENMVGETV